MVKSISTRSELKKLARRWKWAIVLEENSAIVFLLKSGQTLAAKYDQDTDKLTKITDTANSCIPIPFIFEEDEE